MIRHVSKVVLYDSHGFLVMQQRDYGADAKNPGKLSFFGGGVEKGESNALAALRELKEETNVKAVPADLTHIYSKFVWDKDELLRVHYYQLSFPVATETLEVYEGSRFVVVDPKELRQRDMSLTPIVRRVVKNMRVRRVTE